MKDTLRDSCDASAEYVRNCCVSPIIARLYFVVFVLMAQFVLVNVVVAVLMKHLDESHKQMEDDIDMEEELEQVLAVEVAKTAVIEQLKIQQLNQVAGNSLVMYPLHKPIYKMASLPANFTFNCEDTDSPPRSPTSLLRVSDTSFNSSTASPIDFHHHQHFRNHQAFPTTAGGTVKQRLVNSCMCDDANNVNIRQASPEEPVDKVAVADLRTSISPVPSLGSFQSLHHRSSGSPSAGSNRNSFSLFPNSYLLGGAVAMDIDIGSNRDVLSLPGSQWSIDNSYTLFPSTSCGEGVLTSLSSSSTVEAMSPDRGQLTLLSTPMTPEGGNLCPPPTYQSVVGKSGKRMSLDSIECELVTPLSPSTLSSFHLNIFEDSDPIVERSGTLENLHDLLVFGESECRSATEDKVGHRSRTPSTSSSHVTTSSSAESSPSSSHHLLGSSTSRSSKAESKLLRRRISTPATTTTSDSLVLDSFEHENNLSSLNLTGLGGHSSMVDDDSLTDNDDELGFYDSLEKSPTIPVPLQQEQAEVFDYANEDVIIMDPTRNTIICIYGDELNVEQQPLLSTVECDSTYRTSREESSDTLETVLTEPSSASKSDVISSSNGISTQDICSKVLNKTAHEATKSTDTEGTTSSGIC